MTDRESLVSPGPKLKELLFGQEMDDKFVISGYRKHAIRTYLSYSLIVVTGGLAWFVFHWNPELWLFMTAEPVSFDKGDTVLVREKITGKCWIEKLDIWQWDIVRPHIEHIIKNSEHDVLCTFIHKKQRFAIVEETIYVINGLSGISCQSLSAFAVSDFEMIQDRSDVFGLNVINVEVPSFLKIFLDEIVSPFYVFQVCSVILWMLDDYVYYASSIIVITVISAWSTIMTIRTERKNLQKMVELNNFSIVDCRRDGSWTKVESQQLVPGDIILVPPGGTYIPADCVVITGNAIVNEGMLTGECIPVQKTPIKPSHDIYYPETFKVNTLFAGTIVLQTRSQSGECTAMVARTGYETAKGQLVQSILYPKDVNYKLAADAAQFLLLLSGTASIGFIYSVVSQYYNCVQPMLIVTKSLDIITIVVPPALPAALSVGLVWAVKRIKKKNIFTISPQRINLAGSINITLFDKTGTLTEDGLQFKGFDQVKSAVGRIETKLTNENILTQCLAACHSLTRIDNELAGGPLEVEMFNATGWNLFEPGGAEDENFDQIEPTYVMCPNNQHKIIHLRQFPFSSEDARQTVVVEHFNGSTKKLRSLIKGAPETIEKLCSRESVPISFKNVLDGYSQKGYRVIALASKELTIKKLKVQRCKRDDLETGATFVGLLIFQNRIKNISPHVITELHEAKIRTGMVTGDNVLTSIAVAFECNILNASHKLIIGELLCGKVVWRMLNTTKHCDNFPLALIHNSPLNSFEVALTGDVFEWLVLNQPNVLEYILIKTKVFARMSPENKAALVDCYEQLELVSCFCGDGANDCGALKRASVGISLSELEASVAAPFTAKCGDISCVRDLIKEGRAALMTSFGMFKYMALYSMIQFCTILILYWRKTNLSDWEYLYIDLIIIDLVALTMSLSHAYDRIADVPPPRALVTASTIFSLLIHIIINVFFQIFVYFYTIYQPWFCSISDDFPPCFAGNATISTPNNGTIPASPVMGNCDMNDLDEEYYPEHYATVALFLFSQFQYIHMSFVFSVGKPFRQPVWRNLVFLGVLLVLTVTSLFFLFTDMTRVIDLFQMKFDGLPLLPYYWGDGVTHPIRIWILCLAVLNWLVSWAVEDFIVNNRKIWKALAQFQTERHKHKRFMGVEKEIFSHECWPPNDLKA